MCVFPTPTIAMVGLNEDENRILPSRFQKDGNKILLVGTTTGEFGGSLYLKELFGETVGSLSEIDYAQELRLWELVIEANKRGLLESAKDVNVGGVAIAIAKMAVVSGKGAIVEVSLDESRKIFDESQGRALLEVSSENLEAVERLAIDLGLKIEAIGEIGGNVVKINAVEMPLEKAKEIYFGKFAEVIEQDL